MSSEKLNEFVQKMKISSRQMNLLKRLDRKKRMGCLHEFMEKQHVKWDELLQKQICLNVQGKNFRTKNGNDFEGDILER